VIAMKKTTSETGSSRRATNWSNLGTAGLGGLLGGLVGGFLVVGVTLVLKAAIDFVSSQSTWLLVVIPLVGLALAVVVLQLFAKSEDGHRRTPGWRTFPRGAIRADITGDVMETAGEEERFPWRLAPIRTLAIFATVGLGGAMGTEAPAAYIGVAAGAWLGDRGRWWRRLLRPAALAGGAAGVAAVMGIALVGTAYMLEVGWGHRARLTAERVTAAVIGGLIGWAINDALHLTLVGLVVPTEAPASLTQAMLSALMIGTASGAITAVAGLAIYRTKKWQASPIVRLVLAGSAAVMTALLIATIAAPSAAVGPGGGAIAWAQTAHAAPLSLLTVSLLRAAATIAASAAGGCGGVFVPFIAVGDVAGRVFAPSFGVHTDLAGAAGAAGGIAGGYRLPFTAVAMVLGIGGAPRAMLTCLATIAIAFVVGAATESALEKFKGISLLGIETPAH
jgi:H+/Cl- antiporter ClcA